MVSPSLYKKSNQGVDHHRKVEPHQTARRTRPPNFRHLRRRLRPPNRDGDKVYQNFDRYKFSLVKAPDFQNFGRYTRALYVGLADHLCGIQRLFWMILRFMIMRWRYRHRQTEKSKGRLFTGTHLILSISPLLKPPTSKHTRPTADSGKFI